MASCCLLLLMLDADVDDVSDSQLLPIVGMPKLTSNNRITSLLAVYLRHA